MSTIKIADLFCGAGGTSTGAVRACERAGYRVGLTAINHWQTAVDTHTANHVGARHLCADLDALNPRTLFAEGELDILWASPECTNHSIARGGRPIKDQSRATAWCVTRWAEALMPRVILVENVKEFLDWGPLVKDKDARAELSLGDTSTADPYRPDPECRGAIFRAWVGTLQAIGYTVDYRILCAADYGDPTTRKRLFIQAVRGGRKIKWPSPTHAKGGLGGLGGLKPWVSAREIIDWSDKGRSVFNRPRPLAPATMRRIMAGLNRYGFREPFTLSQQSGGVARKTTEPLQTVATSGAISLIEPFLVEVNHGGDRRARGIHEPMPTVTCGHSRGDGRNVGLCEPFIVAWDQQSGRGVWPQDEPLSTVVTKQRHGVCEPYLVKYYGSGGSRPVTEPIDTITGKDRFGLAQPVVEIDGERYAIDILFRMLKPSELAKAQGFPDGYRFTGKTAEVVKQIGNAVPTNLAEAIVRAVITQ